MLYANHVTLFIYARDIPRGETDAATYRVIPVRL
jgi:hypothetical protein